MYHWGESAPFRCDYEKKGCYIKSDDKVVVDVGANIGIFTRLALERGVERVYAFEPSFDAFKCLMMNVDSNRVVPYKACVTNVSGFTDVTVTPSTYPMAVVIRDDTSIGEVETVPSYTMDDLIDLNIIPIPIDFLKVDIEGSEVEMFEGFSDENLAKIDRFAMEAHLAPDLSLIHI